MSNLVQAAEELEYVPKEELVRMMEQGDMKYPPYLVLSEIQRRTQLENMVMQPKPNTTVAQEVVSEFAQPQGLAGMPQGMSADISLPPSSQTVYEDRGIPASGMAAGGYLGGGQMTYTGPTIYDDEGNELEGLEGLQALKESKGLSRLLRVFGMNEGGITGYADKGQTETTGSKIKSFLTAPIRAISDLGRLQYEAGVDANNRLKEKISTNADIRNDLITKSLPVLKGEKTLQEFKKEMEELFYSDFIKDDRNYRNQIKDYYYNFEQRFLPRFQKEIAETGDMPKDIIGHYNKYENFRNSSRYRNPFDTGYERPDLSLSEKMQKKQEGGLLGFNTGIDTTFATQFRDVVSPVTGFLNSEEAAQFGRIVGNPALRQTFTNLYNIDYKGRPGGLNTRVSPEKQRRSFLNTFIYSPENLKSKIEEYNEFNKGKKDFTSIDFDALGIPTPQEPVSGDGTDSNIFKAPTIKENQTPEKTETNQNITDIVKGQMGKFGLSSTALTPPTEEQRNREKQALILSTLAKNIGSATNLSGIGEGLADATALAVGKSASDRKEDAEFLKAQRADVVSEIQIISSLQDIGARIRSNDIKERQLGQQNAQLLFDLLQDPTINLDPKKKEQYLKQLESYFSLPGATTSPSTGVGGVSFTK